MIGPDQPLPISIRTDPVAVAQYQALWDVLLRDEAVRALRPLTMRNFMGFVRRIAGPHVDPMEVRLHWSMPQILEQYCRVQQQRTCSAPVVRAHARWLTTWLGRTVAPRVLACTDASLTARPTVPPHIGEKKHYFDVDEVQRLYASARLDPSGLDPAILTILFTTGLTPAPGLCGTHKNPLLRSGGWVVPPPVGVTAVAQHLGRRSLRDPRKGGAVARRAARTLCEARARGMHRVVTTTGSISRPWRWTT